MLKPVIKAVSFLFCVVMPVNGVESSGMEPFLETTTFLDEDMLLTIPDVHVDPAPTSSQESFSSNITNASPSNPRVITSTQKISEVASGEHPVIQSKENLTETYFPWKRSDNVSISYKNASSTTGNATLLLCEGEICSFTKNEQSKMPILFLLIGICLPLLMISILMVYLCYKHRKTRKCSTNLSYLWRTEEGTEYSEALSTPDSPSELGARSDSSVCYVNMNLNNNIKAVRSGRVYPSLIGNNAVDSVRRGDLEEVHQLMFMNVSFKGEKDLNGWSVLHIAVYNHDVLMLKMLLEGVEEGLVDLLERNNDGQSPIVFAASLCNNQLDCVALLIDALSDVRNCNNTIEGQSGNKKQLPLLGENINEWALVDDLGRNVIHYSSLNNSPQAILFFASFGADVNYIDFRGDSPLHLATREGHGPSVQALLDCGVKTDIKNADGIEPIAIAENRNFSVLADKLRRASVEKPLGRKRQRRRTTAFPTSDSTRGSCDSGIFHHDSFRSESGSKRSSLSFSSDLDLERCQSSTYVPGYEIGSPTEAYQEAADLCCKNYSRKRTFLPPLACDTYDEFFTPSVILPTLQQTESESFPASLDTCETDSCTDSSSVSDRKRTQAFGESQDKDRIALGRKCPPFSARMHTFKPSNASDMSTDTSSIAKKVAIGAVICCGSAAALYYLLKRLHTSSANTSSVPATAEVTNATIEELKALGNKLFSERKYHEAIEMFSRAIQKEGEGCEATKAMCFQNRAASKEKANGFTIQDCLDDYAHAIEMNPSYGKAFFRRSILLHKDQKHGEALAEIFCAIYLDPSLEKNASSLMPVLVEELEKEQHEAFNKEHTRGLPKHVRHERVYAWLHKTVVNDPLKHLVFSSNIPGQKLAEAVRLINNFKYDEVAKTAADEMEEDCRLEALLLAARFSAYENKATEVEHYIEAFNTHYDNLIEFEQDKKKHLKSSLHIIKIETASTKEAILQNFYDAIATDLHNVDYYAMAAFRLVNYGEAHEAMKILSTESLDENNNIKLLRLTLSILANTDGNLDAARLHTAIKDLDDFVQSMETPSPYAKSLLAKVYSTFSQAEPAQELMEFVFAAEPEQSIYYFDRSCMSNSGEEAMTYLRKCLDLEPYHAEANLMYASLMVNEFGNRLNLERKDYDDTMEYLDRAAATFDGSPDFPVITGVFRLREILKAKLTAAKKLNLLPDA